MDSMKRVAVVLAVYLGASLGVLQAPLAAGSATAPFHAKEEYRDLMQDSLGMGSAYLDGFSDPSLGSLSASSTATSTAPVGVEVPNIDPEPNRPLNGNEMLMGASWARGRMRIVHRLPVAGPGEYTVRVQLTDITARTSTTYRHEMIGGWCLCDVLESGYAWARAQITPFFYPCAIGASCTGYPVGYQVDLPPSGTLEMVQPINAHAAGHIAVKVGLLSEAFAKGSHSSYSSASFRVASISVDP